MKQTWAASLLAHPVRGVCIFYALLTLVGGGLLSLPQSASVELRHEEGDYLYKRMLNCAFTSASAVTLTGLSVYDTGRDFSRFGQWVVLGLILGGGIAALTLSGLFAWRQPNMRPPGRPVWLWVAFVIALMLVNVATGALFARDLWRAPSSPSPGWFSAVFHAVNGFCNAGFTLSRDSLVRLRGETVLYAEFLLLMVLGSLGTVFVLELLSPVGRRRPPFRLTLYSMLVVFLLAPVGLLLTESRDWRRPEQRPPPEVAAFMPPAMTDLPTGQRAAAALFQATSARSAGFRTVALDRDSLSPAGVAWLSVLMFIGGAPGSTAGGISTLALALLLVGMIRRARVAWVREADSWRPPGDPPIRGEWSTGDSRPSIPPEALRPALMVFALVLGLVALTGLALYFTERGNRFIEVAFEAVSASTSSGMSLGLTSRLSIPGRIVLILSMLSGRILNVCAVAALWSHWPGDSLDLSESGSRRCTRRS